MRQFPGAEGRRAFTLIELLVVIVILAILMGLLIPLLAGIRERGRATKCVSNLKQLHAAAMVFATDNGILPYGCSTETLLNPSVPALDHTGWIRWYNYRADMNTYWHNQQGVDCIKGGSLWGYVEDLRMYVCPTVQAQKTFAGLDTFPGTVPGTTVTNIIRSYSMNSAMSGYNWFTIQDASRRMLFADAAIYHNRRSESSSAANLNYYTYFSLGGPNGRSGGDYPNVTGGYIWRRSVGRDAMMEGTWLTAGPSQYAEGLGAWHDGYAHCVFVDGHVERVWYTNGMAVCAGTWGTID